MSKWARIRGWSRGPWLASGREMDGEAKRLLAAWTALHLHRSKVWQKVHHHQAIEYAASQLSTPWHLSFSFFTSLLPHCHSRCILPPGLRVQHTKKAFQKSQWLFLCAPCFRSRWTLFFSFLSIPLPCVFLALFALFLLTLAPEIWGDCNAPRKGNKRRKKYVPHARLGDVWRYFFPH